MMKRIAAWCSATALGVAAGAVFAWEPPVSEALPGALPPVIHVGPDGEALPPARLAPGLPYADHDSGCDCESCQPKYIFPHRRDCGGTLFFRPDGYWNTVTKPKLQESHWGYCDQFCERPFGIAVSGHFQRQVINGLGQQMMLYEYDFTGPDSDRLSPRGRYQLEKIVMRSQQGLGPVQVAATYDNDGLDDARRASVERELRKLGVAGGANQVVVRRAPTPSFNGYEAMSIQRNRESGVQTRGVGGLSGSATSTTNSNSGATTGS